MRIKNKKHLNLKNERGAAAVEFALLLPALALIIIGMMFFGIILNSYLEITHAAREGVRWAALRAPFSDVQDKAQAAAPGIDWSKATVTRTGVSNDPPTDDDQGNPVTVTVTYQISEIKDMFQILNINMPDTIHSSATQRVE